MAEVKRHFRPEFLNRLDDIVVFPPLSRRDLGKIVMLQLNQLAKRLDDRNVKLQLTDAAVEYTLQVTMRCYCRVVSVCTLPVYVV